MKSGDHRNGLQQFFSIFVVFFFSFFIVNASDLAITTPREKNSCRYHKLQLFLAATIFKVIIINIIVVITIKIQKSQVYIFLLYNYD